MSANALSKIATSSWRSRACSTGTTHLDPPVEVARHQVGAAEEELGLVADLERVEAAVLEEAADDRADADVLAHPGHARA